MTTGLVNTLIDWSCQPHIKTLCNLIITKINCIIYISGLGFFLEESYFFPSHGKKSVLREENLSSRKKLPRVTESVTTINWSGKSLAPLQLGRRAYSTTRCSIVMSWLKRFLTNGVLMLGKKWGIIKLSLLLKGLYANIINEQMDSNDPSKLIN